MTPLFFLFNIDPTTSCLVVAFWVIVFLICGIKDTTRKGYKKKDRDKWSKEDWKEYRQDVQRTLDDYNQWKRDCIRDKGIDPDDV